MALSKRIQLSSDVIEQLGAQPDILPLAQLPPSSCHVHKFRKKAVVFAPSRQLSPTKVQPKY
jgi:hypothetical protein